VHAHERKIYKQKQCLHLVLNIIFTIRLPKSSIAKKDSFNKGQNTMIIPRSINFFNTRKIRRIAKLMNQCNMRARKVHWTKWWWFVIIFIHHIYTRLQKENGQLKYYKDMKAYIIKFREQPNQLYPKHVWSAKRIMMVLPPFSFNRVICKTKIFSFDSLIWVATSYLT
jgi:hypothetical protein